MSKAPRQGKEIAPSIIARVANGLRGFVAGINADTWFSPGQPIPQEEPDAQRIFEYDPGINVEITPRHENVGIYQSLRNLSDNCDLVRLAIETRKDQLGALDFIIQAKKGKSASESRINYIQDKLLYPDNQHPWSTWLRMLVEDLLVVDAPTIYPRRTLGGELYSLEIIDGTTVKRILDAQGRTPLPPSIAYQQILYGIPAVDFNRDQLIFMPRNPRAHKVYGYSPVEQIITTINIAIRKQIYQLQYYTEGTVPDAFATVPQGWTPDDIRKFQRQFDALLRGDTARRRKVKFLPPGSEIVPVKKIEIKDMYDEWLARIICFAFSLPATPFINQINRSTAEAAQETALEEGIAPLKQWVKDLMNYIIAKYFGEPDIEFAWQPGEIEQDPLTLAQIQDLKLKNGSITKDEAREQDGREPLTEEQLAQIAAQNNPPANDETVKKPKNNEDKSK